MKTDVFLGFSCLLTWTLFEVVSAGLISPERTKRGGATKPDTHYNYLDLVVLWGPAACSHSSRCRAGLPQHWTLHGLWPSVSYTSWPEYCGGSCSLDVGALSADLLREMQALWPTLYQDWRNERFWRHEYCKHGTCTADILPLPTDYFSQTIRLYHALDIDGKMRAAGIVPHAARSYSFSDLDRALNSLGLNTTRYWCRETEGKQLLSRLGVCVERESLHFTDCPGGSFYNACDERRAFYFLPAPVLPGSNPEDKSKMDEIDQRDSKTSDQKTRVRDYGQLLQRYGPDNITVTFSEHQGGSRVEWSCSLTVQGLQFVGQSTSKQKAKNEAVRVAILALEAAPPPIDHWRAKGGQQTDLNGNPKSEGKLDEKIKGQPDSSKEGERRVKDFGQLLQRYGPENINVNFSQLSVRGWSVKWSCKLTVQGLQFVGQSTSKQKAKNEAVRVAILALEAAPLPIDHWQDKDSG